MRLSATKKYLLARHFFVVDFIVVVAVVVTVAIEDEEIKT